MREDLWIFLHDTVRRILVEKWGYGSEQLATYDRFLAHWDGTTASG